VKYDEFWIDDLCSHKEQISPNFPCQHYVYFKNGHVRHIDGNKISCLLKKHSLPFPPHFEMYKDAKEEKKEKEKEKNFIESQKCTKGFVALT
jgi:hypothetical protein